MIRIYHVNDGTVTIVFFMQNLAQSKTLVRTFLMLAEHFPGPCGPFVVLYTLIIAFLICYMIYIAVFCLRLDSCWCINCCCWFFWLYFVQIVNISSLSDCIFLCLQHFSCNFFDFWILNFIQIHVLFGLLPIHFTLFYSHSTVW